MKEKKTILHIIQNFGLGGAETAVVGVLKKLKDYNNIVVTLDPLNQFGNDLQYDRYYCLNLRSYYLFPTVIGKLRRIIRENKVDLVHSQLYWSTVLARYACPKDIPLVTSIQASLTDSVEYKKNWICQLDRISYKHRPGRILGVSEHTLHDYFSFLRLKPGRSGVLYNFVDTAVFNKPANPLPRQHDGTFRLVTVGNLKPQKNQLYLLRAFRELKDQRVTLDIFGDGQLEASFRKIIEEEKLPVRLMGKVRNLPELLPAYDLFVMSSFYEGFSLAVLEGMAQEKPMLLSDIPTFREQCAGTAEYFSLQDVDDFVQKVQSLKNDLAKLRKMAAEGRERVLQNFTLDHHLENLRKIYMEELHIEQT